MHDLKQTFAETYHGTKIVKTTTDTNRARHVWVHFLLFIYSVWLSQKEESIFFFSFLFIFLAQWDFFSIYLMAVCERIAAGGERSPAWSEWPPWLGECTVQIGEFGMNQLFLWPDKLCSRALFCVWLWLILNQCWNNEGEYRFELWTVSWG